MENQFKRTPMRIYPMSEKWFSLVKPEAKEHLLRSLASLEAGRDHTPSFKLYGKSDVSLVDDFFAKVKQKGIDVPKWQLEYEMSRKEKFGPQGGYLPWSEVKELFLMYYERPEEITEPLHNEDQIKKYSDLHVRMPSLTETLNYLKGEDKIQERAAGWNNFNLKKTDPEAQREAIQFARDGNWRKGKGYPFERYQKRKPRIFFPMPFCLMLKEAQYYAKFLAAIQADLKLHKEKSKFVFWADKIGFDPMFNDIVSPLCYGYNAEHLVFIQRDFEKMDTTTGFSQTYHSLIPKLAKAYSIKKGSQQWNELCELLYFGATCPILTPDGVYVGYRGKPSGANTTNGDETCSNEDYSDEVHQRADAKFNANNIKVQLLYSGGNGDDGIDIYHLEDLKQLDVFKKLYAEAADEAAKLYKFRVQGSKWLIEAGHGLYCQRMLESRNGKIWNGYPAALILNAIVNPEKEYSAESWDKDYRDIDIIEKLDNGANLQYFHELVDFVDNGMKYRLLGKSEEATRRILSKYGKYRALQQENFNWQDLENRGDITKSPTVKYLLEKRHWSI